MINDRLPIAKVSGKFSIPIIYNFAVIYQWNVLFFKKVAYFLKLSIVFSVCKKNFTSQEHENLNSNKCKNLLFCYLCWSNHILLLLLLLLILLWYDLLNNTFKYYHVTILQIIEKWLKCFRWLKKDYICEALTLTFSGIIWSKVSYL